MRFKIATKLCVLMSVFLIQITLLVAVLLFLLSKQEKEIANLYSRTEKLHLISQMRVFLQNAAMPVNDFLIPGGDPDEKENFIKIDAKINAFFSTIEHKIKLSRPEKLMMNHIKDEYIGAREIAQSVFSMAQPIGNPEAGRLMEKLDAILDDATKDGEKFYQLSHHEYELTKLSLKIIKDLTHLFILIGLFLNIALILFTISHFIHTISQPLTKIKKAAIEIGKGHFQKDIIVNTHDEIEELSYGFNKMQGDLKLLQDQIVQSEKLASLGTLATGIAHEIKNPLAIITQGLQFIKSSIPKELKLDDEFDKIEKSASRADKIVKDLLSFSKHSPLVLENSELCSLLDDTLFLLEHRIKEKNITVSKIFPHTCLKSQIDVNKIQQVFLNIFLNAIEAVPYAGRITVKLTPITQNTNNYAQISIADNGSGIAREHLTKIFDPFFSTKAKGQGTGLGLSVSKGIIDMHNGSIRVETRQNEGTSVIINLPIGAGNDTVKSFMKNKHSRDI